jgi:hypothetical protein
MYDVNHRYALFILTVLQGRAIAEAVSRWLPTAAARFTPGCDKWDLWWIKWGRGRFSPSTSVSPAKNHSFHQLLHHHHNHPGQVQKARSGRGVEWTQYGLRPPLFGSGLL